MAGHDWTHLGEELIIPPNSYSPDTNCSLWATILVAYYSNLWTIFFLYPNTYHYHHHWLVQKLSIIQKIHAYSVHIKCFFLLPKNHSTIRMEESTITQYSTWFSTICYGYSKQYTSRSFVTWITTSVWSQNRICIAWLHYTVVLCYLFVWFFWSLEELSGLKSPVLINIVRWWVIKPIV